MDINFQSILEQSYLGNTVFSYLKAVAVFVVLDLVFKLFRKVLIIRLDAFARSTKTTFDDSIVNALVTIHPRFYDFLAFYVALKYLHFTETVDLIINDVAYVIIVVQIVISLKTIVDYIIKKFLRGDRTEVNDDDQMAFYGISLFAGIILWISGLLWLLSNFGFNITSLAASLGIGGIAIALAVQNILGDIFSSFSIYFDKPFAIGDFIIIGTDMGTVEKIGLKTTRIRTLQGEELVISNKELTSTRIQNFKKMEKRRVVFMLGVTYDTSLDQLKQIPGIIRKIYEEVDGADLDRVHFKEFADFSLNVEVVYYHLSGDYTEYMDIREKINLRIKEEFDKAEIEFAFPTQTLHISQ